MKYILILIAALFSFNALAEDLSAYTWNVSSVFENGTIQVDKNYYPPELGPILIKPINIDFPSGTNAKCKAEQEAYIKAENRLIEMVKDKQIIVSNIQHIKDSEYLYAKIEVKQSSRNLIDVSNTLVGEGLVHPSIGSIKTNYCQ